MRALRAPSSSRRSEHQERRASRRSLATKNLVSARNDELLNVPGAKPAVMGADRPMGPGWITVSRDGLITDKQLAFWTQVGLEHQAARAKSHHGSRTR